MNVIEEKKYGEWMVQMIAIGAGYYVRLFLNSRIVHDASFRYLHDARRRFRLALLSAMRGYQTKYRFAGTVLKKDYYHVPPQYARAVALLTAALGTVTDDNETHIDGVGTVYYVASVRLYSYWIYNEYPPEQN